MIRHLVARFAAGLRFPTLFVLTATLFVVDLLVPDLIPFLDEVMLALAALAVGALRKRPQRGFATLDRGDLAPPH